jgi:hypothetical protein
MFHGGKVNLNTGIRYMWWNKKQDDGNKDNNGNS